MSQWARENPELCAEGVTAYDYYAERVDHARQQRKDDPPCVACNGKGSIDRPLIEGHPDVAAEVTSCPDCGGSGKA